MSVLATPGYDLIPSAERVATSSNYLTNADFDFMHKYFEGIKGKVAHRS